MKFSTIAVPAAMVFTVHTSDSCAQSLEGKELPKVPPAESSKAKAPADYRVEVVMRGLTYPTSVEFDDQGTMYVSEAGYSYGDAQKEPRIIAVSITGEVTTLSTSGLKGPVTDLLWHKKQLYVSHRGAIAVLDPATSQPRSIVTGLPSEGDHHTNQMSVGPDGKIYFGQGTATNSGVVGIDNHSMGWLEKHPDFHDVPAKDITLKGQTFETTNPVTGTPDDKVKTSAFQAFGTTVTEGAKVAGKVKASGTILRMNDDGSDLEVYAWGLRNPYGVHWAATGKLYVSENGFDARGSRPIANDKEDVYEVKEGAWYGWPDFGSGTPVTNEQFKPDDQPQPQFLMADHPPVEQPLITFPPHSAATQLESSRSDEFGFKGDLFLAFFGHMAPMTGKVEGGHAGHRVVRIDPESKSQEVFFTQAGHGGEKSSGHGNHGSDDHSAKGNGGGEGETTTAGPRRLVDVRFSPEGQAMYIVDFGTMVIKKEPVPVPKTEVIWRVVPDKAPEQSPPADLSVD